jgi:hypothetical protein
MRGGWPEDPARGTSAYGQHWERVTRIELALSAREEHRKQQPGTLTSRFETPRLIVSNSQSPLIARPGHISERGERVLVELDPHL